MNLGESLLQALKEAGAKAVFGLPGDYVLPFFQVIEESKILPLYTLSHEPSIGFAADAASRYAGGIGVAVATYGAGAMNLVNAAACAWAEHSPLVIISGAPGANDWQRGLLLHHQIRGPQTQLNVFKEFTCDQAVLDDLERLPKDIARVLESCRYWSRPVYLELPRDMVSQPCSKIHLSYKLPATPQTLDICTDQILQRVKNAVKPTILAGVQVRRYGQEDTLFNIAKNFQIPLVTTLMGKGMFAGQGFPYCGTYLGLAGDNQIRKLVEESDLLLMTGVIPCDTNLGVSGQRIDMAKTIRITSSDVTIGQEVYENIHISLILSELDKCAARPVFQPKNSPRETVKKLDRESPICADDVVLSIEEVFSEKGSLPVSVDIGDCLFMALGLQDVPFLASGYYATMGFGIPAGLGLQAVTGDRPLIIVGDGGFQMSGLELVNCSRYGWNPIVIVLNNSNWEMLQQFQPQAEYTRLGTACYAKMAESIGGDGYSVKTYAGFVDALLMAYDKKDKFQLIEVALKKGDVSTTLKQFVQALKANAAKKIF